LSQAIFQGIGIFLDVQQAFIRVEQIESQVRSRFVPNLKNSFMSVEVSRDCLLNHLFENADDYSIRIEGRLSSR
jgi:hypothetical protein